MSRRQSGTSWRLEAVPSEGVEGLPEEVQRAFDDAANQLQQPGAFDLGAVAVDAQAFSELTGFHPQAGEIITATAVKRAAEAATAARTKALGNCRGAYRGDYVALGVFLRVCAANALRVRAETHVGRRRAS